MPDIENSKPALKDDEKPMCPICRDHRLETARFGKEIEIDGVAREVHELECWLCLECGATTIFKDQHTRNDKRIEAAQTHHGKKT